MHIYPDRCSIFHNETKISIWDLFLVIWNVVGKKSLEKYSPEAFCSWVECPFYHCKNKQTNKQKKSPTAHCTTRGKNDFRTSHEHVCGPHRWGLSLSLAYTHIWVCKTFSFLVSGKQTIKNDTLYTTLQHDDFPASFFFFFFFLP